MQGGFCAHVDNKIQLPEREGGREKDAQEYAFPPIMNVSYIRLKKKAICRVIFDIQSVLYQRVLPAGRSNLAPSKEFQVVGLACILQATLCLWWQVPPSLVYLFISIVFNDLQQHLRTSAPVDRDPKWFRAAANLSIFLA